MKVPKELIEQWRTEYYRSATPIYLPEYIAYRAAEWALSNVSMEPVAWKYKVDPSFDGSKWTDVYEITQSKQVADWKAGGSAMPLFTAAQLAAARQQGAEEERKKWEADMVLHNNGVLRQRIAELEQKNAVFLEALKRARDTAMKYTLVARIPECGHFGEIAQDLDYVYAAIAEVKP